MFLHSVRQIYVFIYNSNRFDRLFCLLAIIEELYSVKALFHVCDFVSCDRQLRPAPDWPQFVVVLSNKFEALPLH